MIESDDYYWDVLEELNNLNLEDKLTNWEAKFMESVLRYGRLTEKRKLIIDAMKEKYIA